MVFLNIYNCVHKTPFANPVTYLSLCVSGGFSQIQSQLRWVLWWHFGTSVATIQNWLYIQVNIVLYCIPQNLITRPLWINFYSTGINNYLYNIIFWSCKVKFEDIANGCVSEVFDPICVLGFECPFLTHA